LLLHFSCYKIFGEATLSFLLWIGLITYATVEVQKMIRAFFDSLTSLHSCLTRTIISWSLTAA
jgi:hypothetical protein